MESLALESKVQMVENRLQPQGSAGVKFARTATVRFDPPVAPLDGERLDVVRDGIDLEMLAEPGIAHRSLFSDG